LVAIGNHHRRGAQVFDGRTGKLLHTIQTPTHSRVWLNADGSLLAISFSDTAEVYDTRTWGKIYSLKDSDFEVAWPVSFSPDGNYLLFNLRKPSGMLLVEAKSGKQLIRIPNATGDTPRDAPSRMTGDGFLVTSGSGNGLSTWDLARIRSKLRELELDWGSDNSTNDAIVDSDPRDAAPDIASTTVEVRWAETRREKLNRELQRLRQKSGKKQARMSIEGWLADAPNDPELHVAYAELNWRHREGSTAIESLNQAIDLAGGDVLAEASLLRADWFRIQNQSENSIDDFKRFLKFADQENEQTLLAKQQLAWELSRSDRNAGDEKLALSLAMEAAEKKPCICSQKALAAALYRNGNFLEAADAIDAFETKNDESGQDVYGGLFIKAMALEQLGKHVDAVAAFNHEVNEIEKHEIISPKRASDWMQLKTEAERILELGQPSQPGETLRLDAFVEVPQAGVYDCAIGICNARDYGKLRLIVNGNNTELEIDGFYEKTVFRSDAELTGLELRKGTNIFTFVGKGKSSISASYYAGIEYIEVRKK